MSGELYGVGGKSFTVCGAGTLNEFFLWLIRDGENRNPTGWISGKPRATAGHVRSAVHEPFDELTAFGSADPLSPSDK